MTDARLDVPLAYVRTQPEPVLPAPIFSRGALAWMRANLFSSWLSCALTMLTLALCALADPAADRLGDVARDLVGAGRRALPRASGRRLLGVHRAEDELFPLRLLSADASAGASI